LHPLAYFINGTVDSLDLSRFYARCAAAGPRNQPFHLAMMVKVLVYAYARLRSSRLAVRQITYAAAGDISA